MIPYSVALKAVGGARTGVSPVNLLDIQDVNGNLYFFSDRRASAPPALVSGQSVAATPPVPLTPGQFIAWSFPESVSTTEGSPASATATPSSADLIIESQSPLAADYATAQWGGFSVPALPSGAVIDAIYGVAISQFPDPVDLFADSGLVGGFGVDAADFGHPGGTGFGSPDGSGQSNTPSLSTSLSDISTMAIGAILWAQGAHNPGYAEFIVTFVAFAVYYHVPSSGGSSGGDSGESIYRPWLLSVPDFTFHRSAVTDSGNFVIQNVSGDTRARDVEKLLRASAFEGAFFVYRCWQPDAQDSWIEVHGTLTVDDVGVDTITLKGGPAISPAGDDSPSDQFCEMCQWRWSSPQCGATGSTECDYSFQTCQVPERFRGVLNTFEKNYGEATANVPLQVINRRRRF